MTATTKDRTCSNCHRTYYAALPVTEGKKGSQLTAKTAHFPSILSFLLHYPRGERKEKKKVARFIKNLYCALNLTLSCSLHYFSQRAVPQGKVAALIFLPVTFICANNESYGKVEAEHASHLLTQ